MSGILESPTLVLNRTWTPVNVTSVRHAISLVFCDRASFVCPVTFRPYDFPGWTRRGVVGGRAVHGIALEIEVPEVVVLKGYEKVPSLGVVFNRGNLRKRDENTCQYCGQRTEPARLTIDHVMPLSRGGETSWENCVLACRRCNNRKGSLTPSEARMKLLRRPFQPEWSPRYAVFARRSRPASWDNFLAGVKAEICLAE